MTIKKLYEVDGQTNYGWNGNSRSIVGWEIEGNELSITPVKGVDITLEGFLALCMSNYAELEKIFDQYSRVNPYKVEIVPARNRTKYLINYLVPAGGFWREEQKDIIYVSCFDKLPPQTIFIPDLMLIVEDLIEELLIDSTVWYRELDIIDPEKDGYTIPA